MSNQLEIPNNTETKNSLRIIRHRLSEFDKKGYLTKNDIEQVHSLINRYKRLTNWDEQSKTKLLAI